MLLFHKKHHYFEGQSGTYIKGYIPTNATPCTTAVCRNTMFLGRTSAKVFPTMAQGMHTNAEPSVCLRTKGFDDTHPLTIYVGCALPLVPEKISSSKICPCGGGFVSRGVSS